VVDRGGTDPGLGAFLRLFSWSLALAVSINIRNTLCPWTRNGRPASSSQVGMDMRRSCSSCSNKKKFSEEISEQLTKTKRFTLGFSFPTRFLIFSSLNSLPGSRGPLPSKRLWSVAQATSSFSSSQISKYFLIPANSGAFSRRSSFRRLISAS
jgi:hypothetical protein